MAAIVGMHRVVDALAPQRPELFDRILRFQQLTTPAFALAPPLPVGEIESLGSARDAADADNLGSLVFPGEIDRDNPSGDFTRAGRRVRGIRAADGELVAFAAFREPVADEIKISWLTTHPRYAGLGLATRLLDDVAAIARAEGKARLSLDVEPDNASAIRLYRSKGFRVVEPDEPQAMLRMEREL